MRVVLDTNVFISGIFWTGNCHKILNKWKEGKFTLITSSECISEIIKVFKDFKIQLPENLIKEWVELIVKNSIIVEISERFNVVEDPKDNIFIETAFAGVCNFIVSQDNHLLKLKEFRKIKIITPEEFLLL